MDVVLDWRNFLTNLDINFDIMVIYDGSKDNTLQILYDNFKNEKNITIVDKKNSVSRVRTSALPHIKLKSSV